jgi:hypothetical protein
LTPPDWQKHVDEPPALGAAWQYRVGHEILEEQRERFGERWVQVRYEELCNAPEPTMARLAEQCGLRWDDEARAALPDDIRPTTDRWREELDQDTVASILEQYGGVLARYEFAPALTRDWSSSRQ